MARAPGAPSPAGPDDLPAAGRDGKSAAAVQAMFDRVAPRYDLANAILSLGQDAHWRRVVARAAEPADRRLLDVAAGSGNVAADLIRRGAAGVIALDLSRPMLAEGARRGIPDVSFVQGDARRLPLPDAAVDGVTIAFGLRNVPDPTAALAEMARVTRPGGRLVVCEFAAPTWPPFRRLYERYLTRLLPELARVVSSSPAAYRYLADSIREWPGRAAVADWIRAAGFAEVEVGDLTGGIVAVHRAVRAGTTVIGSDSS